MTPLIPVRLFTYITLLRWISCKGRTDIWILSFVVRGSFPRTQRPQGEASLICSAWCALFFPNSDSLLPMKIGSYIPCFSLPPHLMTVHIRYSWVGVRSCPLASWIWCLVQGRKDESQDRSEMQMQPWRLLSLQSPAGWQTLVLHHRIWVNHQTHHPPLRDLAQCFFIN